MRTPRLASLCLLAAGAACVSRPAPAPAAAGPLPSANDYAEIVRALQRYYDAFSARDWEAFASHFAPGATIASRWQPPGEPAPRVAVSTVAEFVAKAPEGPGSKPIFEEKMTAVQTRIAGNLAVAWADYAAKFGETGNVAEWTGVDAFTLLRHDGKWWIVSLAYDASR